MELGVRVRERDCDEEVDDGSQAWCEGSETHGVCRNFTLKEVGHQAKTVRLSAGIRKYSLFSQQMQAEPLHSLGYMRTQDNGNRQSYELGPGGRL